MVNKGPPTLTHLAWDTCLQHCTWEVQAFKSLSEVSYCETKDKCLIYKKSLVMMHQQYHMCFDFIVCLLPRVSFFFYCSTYSDTIYYSEEALLFTSLNLLVWSSLVYLKLAFVAVINYL